MFKSCMIAFSMYSRLPVPQFVWEEKNMRYALGFFPLVGLLTAIVELCWFWLLNSTLSAGVAVPEAFYAGVATAVPFFVTGGIHADGFCDTVDALASCQPRERRLEILKDSQVGAFAVIWTVVYCLLLFGGWSFLAGRQIPVFVVCIGFVKSRALSGLTAIYFPNARREGSLYAFTDMAAKRVVSVMLWLFFFAAAVGQIWIYPPAGVFLLVVEVVWTFCYHRMAQGKFGGVTGDLQGWFLQWNELLTVYACTLLSLIGK